MIRESLPDPADPRRWSTRGSRQSRQRAATLLRDIARDYAPGVFANSLGAEDMVLTDLIVASDSPSRSSRSTPVACRRNLRPDGRGREALRPAS